MSVGSDYLVLWNQIRAGTNQVVGTRVLKDGAVIDFPPLLYSRIASRGPATTLLEIPTPIQAIADGTNVLIVSSALIPGFSTAIYRVFANLTTLQYEPRLWQINRRADSTGLTWLSEPNATYLVERSSTLQPGSWFVLPPLVSSAGLTTTLSDPTTDTARFYRLRLIR